LDQKERLTGGERTGKAHSRSLFATERDHQLEVQPFHHRMEIPEQMDMWPVAFFRTRVLDGFLDAFPTGSEVNPAILREGFVGKRPEDATQIIVDG
jgi:hypothetical protein